VYHADWGSKPSKRWCAKSVLGSDGAYTAFAPRLVGAPEDLLESLRKDAGESGIIFAGFDFPIGIPAHFAHRAGISSFRQWLPALGTSDWCQFYSVCDTPGEISTHRPFYPNGAYRGRRKQDLFAAHGASSGIDLMRQCERGGDGRKEACCLFWTLGGNQVGKAAILGWRSVLCPALIHRSDTRLWPFEGSLSSLMTIGTTVIAETYPAEVYRWFDDQPVRKRSTNSRALFGSTLLKWADINSVHVDQALEIAIRTGFKVGDDDAFDAVVGLFGMLKVCLGQRSTGEPNDPVIRNIEGWILGRQAIV